MKRNCIQKAVAFTGISGSGKTSVIVKIANILQDEGYKIAIIKHDPKDKAMFDKEGKDSFKFSQTKADVVVTSPFKTTYFKPKPLDIKAIAKMVSPFDFLLVEGLKSLNLPRICICRGIVDEGYFDISDTIAIDHTIDKNILPKGVKLLNLNDTNQIVAWIKQNAKEMKV
ncbi:MAG: molybdopterin-guanine dinucleotide biosynthesis protein B [Epsilonproteobacteria bacterium]|nr:MAG: molybdopterin-guanine dinucleotide biosynthesis protein B [Campylobacterota bacterium]